MRPTILKRNHLFSAPLLTLVIVSTLNCTKSSNSLPPVTSNGNGTFGCYIDGKLFTNGGVVLYSRNLQVSYGFADPSQPDTSEYNRDNPFLLIHAVNNDKAGNRKSLFLQIRKVPAISGKTYALGTFYVDTAAALYSASLADGTAETDQTGNGFTGTLVLSRFDTAARIVSGTFSFDAYNLKSDTVHFTQGRFDVVF